MVEIFLRHSGPILSGTEEDQPKSEFFEFHPLQIRELSQDLSLSCLRLRCP